MIIILMLILIQNYPLLSENYLKKQRFPKYLYIIIIMPLLSSLERPEYPLVQEKEADAIGWAFNGPYEEGYKYNFKFPKLQDHEIRIKVLYFGLCYTDCHIIRKDWFDPPYPLVPGHEICGTVVERGSKVYNFNVGDLVGYGFMRNNCGECGKIIM